MTRHGRMVAAALALGLLGGAANAQGLLNPPGGDQRGGGPRQENRGEPQRPENRGPAQRPGNGPDRNGDHHEGPRASDSRGQFRGGQNEWRRGDRIDRDDWNRGGRIDYRERHLRQPPRGYEWREVNGSLILGAIATGVIADILLNQR